MCYLLLDHKDDGGSYRRNRRDIHVVLPATPPRVTTPSMPSRDIPTHNPNCVIPNQIATTTPGSNDGVKMLHNHQMDQLSMNIMSLNLDAYPSQHLDINGDIDENTD